MIQLRPYQREAVDQCKGIIRQFGCCYLAAEMRTGKGIMSLTICYELGYKRICFITVKKNIINAEKDIEKCRYPVHVDIFSVDSIHKIVEDYDIFIVDEAHTIGTFPTANRRQKRIKELTNVPKPLYKRKQKPVILMSGTPSPESYSQLYHQFQICYNGPFNQYTFFYKWAKQFVKHYEFKDPTTGEIVLKPKQKYLYGDKINDYSEAIEEKVQDAIRPYMVNVSQEDAGFESMVEEHVLNIPIDNNIYRLMSVLKKDRVYTMKCGDVIIADSPNKLKMVYHQICSGTVIAYDPLNHQNKRRHQIDKSKAYFIKSKFAGQKIAIYYKFIEEGNLLREVFPDHTTDQEKFNKHDHLTFICQIKSGSMGVDLNTADALVMYNIDFSATLYWQVRARIQAHAKTRASKVYWVFSEHGIERKIYNVVMGKKDYTVSFFRRDFLGKRAAKRVEQIWQQNLNFKQR